MRQDEDQYSFLLTQSRKKDLEHEFLEVSNDRDKIINSKRNFLSFISSHNSNLQSDNDDTDEISGDNQGEAVERHNF